MELANVFSAVVMQPTTLCNLNCRYCYLPLRKVNKRMIVEVATAVAHGIEAQDYHGRVDIIWHGGEPLACGPAHFESLVAPFGHLRQSGRVAHVVQTNATLIDERWCDFFCTHGFHVGMSLDGPAWMTDQRVDLGGTSAYRQIRRGVERLKELEIPFSVIAVVNNSNIRYPRELYAFFCELGCHKVGFNIEETEGVNAHADQVDNAAVLAFWKGIMEAWLEDPRIMVRELNAALSFVRLALNGRGGSWHSDTVAQLPTVAWDGNVTLLSPELAGSKSERYHDFVAGNVLRTPLEQIVKCGRDNIYVSDFLKGVERCRVTCRYFNFCRGGMASNKFQEHGSTDATETQFCRNTRQHLVDAVLQL